MSAQFSPSYAPTYPVDTLSSVQIQAQKNGYCDVDGHHDIKIRINLGLGRKGYQECKRCAALHDMEMKRIMLAMEKAEGDIEREKNIRQYKKEYEDLHAKYELEKKLRIEAEVKAEESIEKHNDLKVVLEKEKSQTCRQALEAIKSISNTIKVTVQMMLIGDSGVGKSCLQQRFLNNSFNPYSPSSPVIGFERKDITDPNIQGCNLNLIIWDIAGQERYRTQTTSFFKTVQVFIVCADVVMLKSLANN